MRRSRQLGVLVMAVVLLVAGLVAPAMAAGTVNPTSGSVGNFIQTFQFDVQIAADVTDKAVFNMPWPAKLVNMKCSARLLGGSSTPTYTWTLKAGSTTLATCAPTSAATEAEGTISSSSVSDEAVIHLNYAGTGTDPTLDDAVVVLVWKRQ